MPKFTWDPIKEDKNRRKHGLGFDFADLLFRDALLLIVYDRFQDGEDRFHAIGVVGRKCLLLVHAYPDPDDETFIRVIGLREATPRERSHYEEGDRE